jgi:hypothetical protein
MVFRLCVFLQRDKQMESVQREAGHETGGWSKKGNKKKPAFIDNNGSSVFVSVSLPSPPLVPFVSLQ